MTTHLRYESQTRAETDQSVIDNLVRKGWEVFTPEPVVEVPPIFTAEQWIDGQGYTAIRLISLLDAEVKLNAANKTSPKMSAVRAWLDSMLGSYALDQTPKTNWPNAPYSYEETIQEAITTLTENPET
jgi:hypothetical protein